MELARTRDVVVLVKDLAVPVRVSSGMTVNGWPGGQGVQWAGPTGSDELVVTYSDGISGLFLLWGSDEDSDHHTSYTGNQPRYQFATACVGSWIISTSTYEKYTLESRLVLGQVPNTFVPGESLRFSLRGYFTPQDEWTINGDPRAPNENFVGVVIQAPSDENNHHLMLQTAL